MNNVTPLPTGKGQHKPARPLPDAPKPMDVGTATARLMQGRCEIFDQKGLEPKLRDWVGAMLRSGATPKATREAGHGIVSSIVDRSFEREGIEQSEEQTEMLDEWLYWFDAEVALEAAKRGIPDVDRDTQRAADPYIRPLGDPERGLEPTDWLVENWIERGSMCVLYGPPGQGKSFVVIDIACAVATGSSFAGNDIHRSGPVIYIAAEGQQGFQRRMAAWQRMRNVKIGDDFFVVPKPVTFFDDAAVDRLVREIELVVEEKGVPELLVVDTVARCFVGGEENSNDDMSRFVNRLDERIRLRFGCTVLLVHHSNASGDKARGGTALLGAVDLELKVEPVGMGHRRLVCTKAKDLATPAPLEYKIEGVFLGEAMRERLLHGQMQMASQRIESAVVSWVEASKRLVTSEAKKAVGVPQLVAHIADHGWTNAREVVAALGITTGTLYRALDAARDQGLLIKEGKGWKLGKASKDLLL